MQQLSIFDTSIEKTRVGFNYRRRLYDDKGHYLYTAIPTKDGFTLNRVQSLAEDIGLLKVSSEEYTKFIAERGLIEKLTKDVERRMEAESDE